MVFAGADLLYPPQRRVLLVNMAHRSSRQREVVHTPPALSASLRYDPWLWRASPLIVGQSVFTLIRSVRPGSPMRTGVATAIRAWRRSTGLEPVKVAKGFTATCGVRLVARRTQYVDHRNCGPRPHEPRRPRSGSVPCSSYSRPVPSPPYRRRSCRAGSRRAARARPLSTLAQYLTHRFTISCCVAVGACPRLRVPD